MILRFSILLSLFFFIVHCRRPHLAQPVESDYAFSDSDSLHNKDSTMLFGNEALLVTRFKSFEDLKRIIDIQYSVDPRDSTVTGKKNPQVQLTHRSAGRKVTSVLKAGVSQTDFMRAQRGTLKDKVALCLKSPFACANRKDLVSIENLGRRYPATFGVGDAAFLDLAEMMVTHITDEDLMIIPAEDLTEKGYLNTFNHLTAQALMTSIFSESTADFIADVHELYNLPDLASGKFTQQQLADLKEGPLDNYIDMINNEWGQELGKVLDKKYSITRQTVWTPALLSDYLNDIQNYCSWALQIGFRPFRPTEYKVIRFTEKLNRVLSENIEAGNRRSW